MIHLLLYTPLILLSLYGLLKALRLGRNNLGLVLISGSFLIFYGLPGAYSGFAWEKFSAAYLGFQDRNLYVSVTIAVVSLAVYLIAVRAYARGFRSSSANYPTLSQARMYHLSILAAFFACVSFYIYAQQYGGFQTVYRYASMIRTGHYLPLEGRSATFFHYFIPLIMFQTLYFAIRTSVSRNVWNYFGLAISTAITLSFMASMSGRGKIVFLMICLFVILLWSRERQKLRVRSILLAACFVLIAVVTVSDGKEFFFRMRLIDEDSLVNIAMSSVGAGNFLEEILSYFATRVYSAEVALMRVISDVPLGYFHEVLIAPLYIVPERIVGVLGVASISQTNTGLLKGTPGGSIPPGIIGYGIYSLWALGPMLLGYIYGYVIGVLQGRMNNGGIYAQVVYLPAMIWWLFFAGAGDPKVLVRASFALIVFGLMCVVYNSFSVRQAGQLRIKT